MNVYESIPTMEKGEIRLRPVTAADEALHVLAVPGEHLLDDAPRSARVVAAVASTVSAPPG